MAGRRQCVCFGMKLQFGMQAGPRQDRLVCSRVQSNRARGTLQTGTRPCCDRYTYITSCCLALNFRGVPAQLEAQFDVHSISLSRKHGSQSEVQEDWGQRVRFCLPSDSMTRTPRRLKRGAKSSSAHVPVQLSPFCHSEGMGPL